MWPFKKKQPNVVGHNPMDCVFKTILKDIEELPVEDWDWDWDWSFRIEHYTPIHKKYTLVASLKAATAWVSGVSSDLFSHRQERTLYRKLQEIHKKKQQIKHQREEEEAKKRLALQFPHCFPSKHTPQSPLDRI